jgi:hypothetical protein
MESSPVSRQQRLPDLDLSGLDVRAFEIQVLKVTLREHRSSSEKKKHRWAFHSGW